MTRASASVVEARGCSFPSGAELLDRDDGLFDTPLIVERGCLSLALVALGHLGVLGVGEHGLDVKRGLLAALEQRPFASERRCRGACTYASAVLSNPVQRDKALVQQAREHVREELVERGIVRDAKLGELGMSHTLVTY